ncbi:MAG: ABC transporter substrate-binding protein [Caldilineaceae bacterium]
MRKSTAIILFTLLLLAFSACTWLGGTQAPSTEEGELLVYTTLHQDEIDLYLADFQIAYPNIGVDMESMTAAALIERMLAERNSPKADLLWGVGLTSVLYLEWNDLLKPYIPVGLTRVEERFRDTNQPPYWVGNNLSLTAFCVNPDEIARLGAKMPTSWRDLLDPSYRRAILMANPATADTGLMAVMGIVELLGEQEGWRYLDALHPNIAFYPQDDIDSCALVDRGEYAIGIAKTFNNLGNVQMVYPLEKSGWELSVSALVRKETITPAARTFLDWSISDPVMRLYRRKSALTAAPTGLSAPLGYPSNPDDTLIDRNIPWSAANRERLLAEWLQRYGDKVR